MLPDASQAICPAVPVLVAVAGAVPSRTIGTVIVREERDIVALTDPPARINIFEKLLIRRNPEEPPVPMSRAPA